VLLHGPGLPSASGLRQAHLRRTFSDLSQSSGSLMRPSARRPRKLE
jgi:hypothetical protein